jgi:transposase-like protein
MRIKCPYCSPEQKMSEKVLKAGRFYRKSQRKWVQRYYCTLCKSHFSSSTGSIFVSQNKRHLNMQVYRLLVSGVSQRRIARLLKIHQKKIWD